MKENHFKLFTGKDKLKNKHDRTPKRKEIERKTSVRIVEGNAHARRRL